MADSSKKMSLMGLTTLVTVNMMGSGIIMLPTSMAQLGAVSLLSWIVTAVGSMAIAYCFSQCGIFCLRSGGLSAYTEEAHAKSGFFSVLLPVLPVAGHCQRGGGDLCGGIHDIVHALAGKRRHSFIRLGQSACSGSTTVANFGGRASPAGLVRLRCGGDHSCSGLEHHRLVLVQTRSDHRRTGTRINCRYPRPSAKRFP